MNLQIEISNEKELDVCVETLSKYFDNYVDKRNIHKYPCYINLHRQCYINLHRHNVMNTSGDYIINESTKNVHHYTFIHTTFRNFWNAYLDYLDTPIINNGKNSRKLLTACYSSI